MRVLTLFATTLFSLTLAAAEPVVQVTRIISGLTQPLAIANAGDSRLFITQQTGKIVIWDGTRVLPVPFLDVSSIISTGGERGLLSIAFHPQYRENGRFFIYYTDRSGNITIAAYRVSSDPNVADASSFTPLLTIAHPGAANHNGGQLQFGPDGFLYAGTGDGGSAGDPSNNAQNTNVLLGKLLRIDVDRGSPYAIPPDNPFANGSGGRPEIWAYGLRNPWRFSFDRLLGDLWIGDVGQDSWEEIDFQTAGSNGGQNYGWRRMEGTHCFNPSVNCAAPGMTPPVIEYSHTFGCSVSGGYRYRGSRFNRLKGLYFYGDYCSGRIWTLSENSNGSFSSQIALDTSLAISTFGEDVNGELYVADISGGAIYQVIDALPDDTPRRRAMRP